MRENSLTLKEWSDNLPYALRNKRVREVAKELGKSYEAFNNWIKGKNCPDKTNQEMLKKIISVNLVFEPVKRKKSKA